MAIARRAISGQDLVNKMMFPAYADAGAINALKDKKTQNGLSVDKNGADLFEKSDDQISVATTAVQDNRSAFRINNNRGEKSFNNDNKDGEMVLKVSETRTDGQGKANTFFPSTSPFIVRTLASRSAPTKIPIVENATQCRSDIITELGLNSSTTEHPNLILSEGNGGKGFLSKANINERDSAIAKHYNMQEEDPQSKLNESINDEFSDILSTSSEMGTVINISTRLTDLDSISITGENFEFCSKNNHEILTEDLSLPIFEQQSNNLSNDSIKDETGGVQIEQGTQKIVTGMVSATFRRFEDNVVSPSQTGGFSAPSTPRAALPMEDYLKSAYRSTGERNLPYFPLRSSGSEAHHSLANEVEKGEIATKDQCSILPKNPHFAHVVSISKMQLEPKGKESEKSIHSKSWDIRSSSFSVKTSSDQEHKNESAFRSRSTDLRVLHGEVKQYSNDRPPENPPKLKDFSSSMETTKNTLELRTTQRVEFEREDALDILEAFVERSIMLEQEEKREKTEVKERIGCNNFDSSSAETPTIDDALSEEDPSTFPILEDDKVSTFVDVGTQNQQTQIGSTPKNNEEPKASHNVDPADVSNLVLKTIYEITKMSEVHSNERDHQNWIKVSNELLRSHKYAVEMKKAAHSASSWLKTISHADMRRQKEIISLPLNFKEFITDNSTDNQIGFKAESPTCKSFGRAIDSLTIRAMLRSLQLYANKKEEEAERLNGELTECRAEIGRLKCATHVDNSFHSSVNRSMLDNDDISDTNNISPVESGSETRITRNSSNPVYDQAEYNSEALEERCILTEAALQKANDVIRELFTSIIKNTSSLSDKKNAPVVPIPTFRPFSNEWHKVNSRLIPLFDSSMIRGSLEKDNFTSVWKKEPPLSPPGDFNLYSPAVNKILKNWTTDSTMHKSLLSWMERVLQGAEPKSIPPLTFSSLEDQVRDDMLLHILPLLQKRPDISIDVKSRTHRKTFYDISVRVTSGRERSDSGALRDNFAQDFAEGSVNHRSTSNFQSAENVYRKDNQRKISAKHSLLENNGATSVSHSTITDQVTNSTSRLISRSLVDVQIPDQYDVEGVSTQNESYDPRIEHPGLIGTLNSTLGGFLSRGKKPTVQQTSAPRDDREGKTIDIRTHNQASSNGEGIIDEPQPYQRVLSCPPGRIGVTFVQYRGHAMVSDVAPGSPLSGWVFPSDILIAIDEVPVSGMRVRNIVKLLTARKDRQRALRVISSHAMNEFTFNTDSLNPHSNS